MSEDLSKRQRVEVACGCGHVETVERWALVDGVARPQVVAELARDMPDPGTCSRCGARLPYQDFFAVLRRCAAGPLCFIFSARPLIPGVTREELLGGTATVWTTQLPFQAAPVLLSRDPQEDLGDPGAARSEIEAAFGHQAAEQYSKMLDELASVESFDRSADLLEDLSEVRDQAQFEALIAAKPELLGDELLSYVNRLNGVESYRGSIEVLVKLLDEARTDPALAWRRYEGTLTGREPVGREMEERIERLDRLIQEEKWGEAIAVATPVLEEAQRLGYGIVAGMVHTHLGIAHLQDTTGDRRQHLESAIEHFESAIALAPNPQVRANQLVNLAAAYGQRIEGDPNENFEESLRLLERASGQIDREREPRGWATLQTNLCRALQVRESGSKVANLERALGHIEAALEARSPADDPDDWAMSQINLGVTLQLLAEQGARDPAAAREAFERVIRERRRLRDWMVAQTLANLAELDRGEARECWERGDAEEQATHLRAAVRTLEEALRLTGPTHPLLRGRLLNHLGDSLEKLGERQAARGACEDALGLLTPGSAPAECRAVASRLGGLLAELEEWQEAAAAYRVALEAGEITFHSRLHSRARQSEMRDQKNLNRWAAYAIARSGETREAVRILEGGRARELRRRIYGEDPDAADLQGLPEDLRDRFLAVAALVRAAALGDDSSGAARALQELFAEIRQRPGYENFGKLPGWEEIAGAAEPGFPLIYLNPTPGGTVLFCVEAGEDGEVGVEAIFRPTPRGTDLAAAMLFGGDLEGESGHSYIGTACGITPDRDLGIALEALLPWLGEEFGRPVAEYLRSSGATGATLIPCGLLGLAPVHAGTWDEAGRRRALIEDFEVRYAASASMQRAALNRRRNVQGDDPHLVAIGNPSGAHLYAAEGEVREIAASFGEAASDSAIGPAATSAFLVEHAAAATHLHLACHARGAAFDLVQSSVALSDRAVTAAELAAVGPLRARLTAASACQTAISEVNDLPEEAISIGTALIGAGSACVIATLWSVNDYATALLMTRLYEAMAGGREPAAALREAQLWMAELGPEEEARYLAAHPHLEEAFARRDLHRDPARWRDTAPSLGAAANRYSHPVFWAPFVAVGA